MSLTSVISSKSSQPLRDKFNSEFTRPKFDLKAELKAPPLTKHYGVVGTALDYAMRFYLEYRNKERFIQRDRWVAEDSYESLVERLTARKFGVVEVGYKVKKFLKYAELKDLLIKQFEQTKINYIHYLSNGTFTNGLIENTIFLAKLDVYFRTRTIPDDFDNHDKNYIADIKNMLSLIDHNMFISKNKCYSNPTFGKGSVLVNGADADVIIDDTLIDFKATIKLRLTGINFNQIIGYYILSLIGGINGNPEDKPIKNIGIYFARHGVLWKIPLEDLGDNQKFEEFKKWFISFVENDYKPFS